MLPMFLYQRGYLLSVSAIKHRHVGNASTLQDVWDVVEKVSKICKADPAQIVSAPSFSSRPTAIFAPEVAGDRCAEALLDVPSSSRRKRAGKNKVADSTSSDDSFASCDETDEDAADSVAPDNYDPLSGGSPLLHNREYESSSQAAMGFSPEVRDNEPPPHDSFFGTAAMEGDNTTFTFAELGLLTKQCPSVAPVKAYVPMPVGGYPAAGTSPEGDSNFIDQLFSCGITSPYFVPATNSLFPFWENTRSPFLEPQAYSAFQVGDTTGDDGGLQQADCNPEPSALPYGGGSFDPYSADLPSSSQGFYVEQSDFI
ncbi:hypothetical protein Taro_031908 [Colocasia esculenta]|uniref:Uncharacterized protein n=1 Tax=Colocasia esculenta TaxID=4460 RepID=A0A843W7U5_COLES|nr:hypothetical protein [Colocasia esculenta]